MGFFSYGHVKFVVTTGFLSRQLAIKMEFRVGNIYLRVISIEIICKAMGVRVSIVTEKVSGTDSENLHV